MTSAYKCAREWRLDTHPGLKTLASSEGPQERLQLLTMGKAFNICLAAFAATGYVWKRVCFLSTTRRNRQADNTLG